MGGILIGEFLVHPNILESKKNIDSKKNQALRVMPHTQHNEWLDFSPQNYRQQNWHNTMFPKKMILKLSQIIQFPFTSTLSLPETNIAPNKMVVGIRGELWVLREGNSLIKRRRWTNEFSCLAQNPKTFLRFVKDAWKNQNIFSQMVV